MFEVDEETWREAHRENNRRDFPTMAKVRDQFDAIFGPCKTIWAEENGKIIGRKP